MLTSLTFYRGITYSKPFFNLIITSSVKPLSSHLVRFIFLYICIVFEVSFIPSIITLSAWGRSLSIRASGFIGSTGPIKAYVLIPLSWSVFIALILNFSDDYAHESILTCSFSKNASRLHACAGYRRIGTYRVRRIRFRIKAVEPLCLNPIDPKQPQSSRLIPMTTV